MFRTRLTNEIRGDLSGSDPVFGVFSKVMAFVAGPESGWITGQRIDVSGGTKL